jgi:hypothetical protein
MIMHSGCDRPDFAQIVHNGRNKWETSFITLLHSKGLVDVAGIEPLTPCLQSKAGETLKALSGVAYTENQRDSRSLRCPEVVPN